MENIAKKLRGGAIAGLAALTLAGCGEDNHVPYRYAGTIDSEKVKMYGDPHKGTVLEVKRKDGTVVRYIDGINDGKHNVSSVEILKDGKIKKYRDDIIGKMAIEEAEKQFYSYLSRIIEEKMQKGYLEKKQQEALDAIKK